MCHVRRQGQPWRACLCVPAGGHERVEQQENQDGNQRDGVNSGRQYPSGLIVLYLPRYPLESIISLFNRRHPTEYRMHAYSTGPLASTYTRLRNASVVLRFRLFSPSHKKYYSRFSINQIFLILIKFILKILIFMIHNYCHQIDGQIYFYNKFI